MIVFDLDNTLADASHRQHFVDPRKDQSFKGFIQKWDCGCEYPHEYDPWFHKETGEKWKPNWRAFYDACDQDKLIWPVFDILCNYIDSDMDVCIWSGRCESVRQKTEEWLVNSFSSLSLLDSEQIRSIPLKMRPIGDSTPDDELKMRWLDEAIAEGKTIEYVFDERPKVVRMWRRRGIFVFNCAQHEEEF